MDLRQSLDIYLRADSTLCAMVGTATPRIYWLNAPEASVAPYIVYRIVDDADTAICFGVTDTGNARIQVDCVALTKTTAISMYKQVRSLMRYKTGTLGTGGVVAKVLFPGGIREAYYPDTHRYVVSCDYVGEYEYV